MDKNSITGMLLMCAVIFGFMWLNKPTEAQIAEQKRIHDSIAQVEAQAQQLETDEAVIDTLTASETSQLRDILAAMPAESQKIENDEVKLSLADGKLTGTVMAGDSVVNIDEVMATTSVNPRAHNLAVAAVKRAMEVYAKNGSFANALNGTEQILKLENDSLAIELNTKGGIISRATLKGYKAYNSPQVEVFTPEENEYGFTLSNNTQRFDTRNFYFTPQQLNDSKVKKNLDLGNGAQWGLKYTLVPGSYMVRMEMVQKGMNQVIPLNINTVDFDWKQKMSRHEEGKMFEERNSAIYYK